MHALDGLVFASHDGQHLIVVHEVGAAQLVALWNANHVRAVEFAVILYFWNVVIFYLELSQYHIHTA